MYAPSFSFWNRVDVNTPITSKGLALASTCLYVIAYSNHATKGISLLSVSERVHTWSGGTGVGLNYAPAFPVSTVCSEARVFWAPWGG